VDDLEGDDFAPFLRPDHVWHYPPAASGDPALDKTAEVANSQAISNTSIGLITPVVRYEGRAKPLVLQLTSVSAQPESANPGQIQPIGFIAGNAGASSSPNAKDGDYIQAMLTYGAGNARKRVWFDWRPGTYQLPPCEFADLRICNGNVGGGSLTYPATFSAAFRPGLTTFPMHPTQTAFIRVAASSFAQAVYLQSQCVAIDMQAVLGGNPNPGDFGAMFAATNPILMLTTTDPPNLLAPTLYRDYVNGIFLPWGGPVPMGAPNNFGSAMVIVNTGTGAANVLFTQWLGL
jgi:hypothetical protein